MTDNTQELIGKLVSDLRPARRLWPPAVITGIWCAATAAYVVAVSWWLAPFRPGFVTQALHTPLFALEMLAGAAAFVGLAWLAVLASIPGRRLRPSAWLACGAGMLWLVIISSGFWSAVLEPSMAGKRPHCVWEAYVYSVPPAFAMLLVQGRRFALRATLGHGIAALGAGVAPAVIMQIACMYDPQHALLFHLGPALLLFAVVAACSGAWHRFRCF